MFGMMIDIGQKFYAIPYQPGYLMVKVMDRIFMLKFYIKVFRASLFPSLLMDFVHFGMMIDISQNILRNAILTNLLDLKVKVTEFSF